MSLASFPTRRAFAAGALLTGFGVASSSAADLWSLFTRRGRGFLGTTDYFDTSRITIDISSFDTLTSDQERRILEDLDEDNAEGKIKQVLFKRRRPTESDPDRDLRLGIVVGHNAKEGGAVGVGPLAGVSEYKFNCETAEMLQDACAKLNGIEAKVFYRTYHGGHYGEEIGDAYGRMWKDYKPDCVTELHFNWAKNKSARYSCVLTKRGRKNLALAGACFHGICSAFSGTTSQERYPDGSFREGLMGSNKGALTALKVPTVIIEPSFAGSNKQDAELLKTKREQMTRSIAAGIRDIRAGLLA